jgi:hypothetical protein
MADGFGPAGKEHFGNFRRNGVSLRLSLRRGRLNRGFLVGTVCWLSLVRNTVASACYLMRDVTTGGGRLTPKDPRPSLRLAEECLRWCPEQDPVAIDGSPQ